MSFLVAAATGATDFGPITISVDPPMTGGLRAGAYAERTFTVTNESLEPHLVRLMIAEGDEKSHLVSRTLTVGSRMTQRVSMAWLVTGRNLIALSVDVDGKSFRRTLPLADDGYTDSDERTILLGRSLDEVAVKDALHAINGSSSEVTVVPRRASVDPAHWSTRWLAYDRYSSVVVSRHDWDELPPAVQAGVGRWVRAGGVLTIVPGHNLDEPGIAKITTTHLGFGRIHESSKNIELLPSKLLDFLHQSWLRVPLGGEPDYSPRTDAGTLLGKQKVPTSIIFWSLLAFAILFGPVTLGVLARKNLRVWIFAIVPVAGVIASIAIVGVTLASEGIRDVARIRAVTLIDETAGEATTVGSVGFYCTFPPDGRVRFDGESELRGPALWRDREVDLTDGQRFKGLIEGRVPTYFTIRKSEPRRERVEFRSDSDGVVAVNALGAAIDLLDVAMPNGKCYRGRHVPAGAQVRLQPVPAPEKFATADAAGMAMSDSGGWEGLADRIASGSSSLLRPGVYLASIDAAPFVELPLGPRVENHISEVVVGQMKAEGGDAH